MAYLTFDQVSYSVRGRTILDRVSFEVNRGETLVLLGSSGSGKTTALRLINRMLTPVSGAIRLEGKDLAALNPIELRRRMGYVIQEFGLLPHWTVRRNIALVPELLGWPAERREQRVTELLPRLGLDTALADRHPHQLSGGQRQRVAVARALAADPALLLFDEPFGALDPVTRHDMQQLFRQVLGESNVAAVFVTHDLLEAVALGTRIAVLGAGKLETIVTPDEFWRADTPVVRAFRKTLPAGVRPA